MVLYKQDVHVLLGRICLLFKYRKINNVHYIDALTNINIIYNLNNNDLV